jgi:hypothetical protein
MRRRGASSARSCTAYGTAVGANEGLRLERYKQEREGEGEAIPVTGQQCLDSWLTDGGEVVTRCNIVL